MNILGISRSTKFSPNSVDRDEAIFKAVVSRLQHLRHDVSVISEDLYVTADLSEFDIIFSMARGRDVLIELAKAADNGILVINDPKSLLANNRVALSTILQEVCVPLPKHCVLNTENEADNCKLTLPLWLKRADACAQVSNDVVFVENHQQMTIALQQFYSRGICSVLAEEHQKGSLVKFYGVEGTSFFYVASQKEISFSKFGLEQYNNTADPCNVDEIALKQMADQAARVSGFSIYGGDAIVQADGTFVFIDFNDWPSFSACRKAAARAIAERIIQRKSPVA